MTPKLMTSAFTALRSAASSLQQHVAKGFRSSWSSVPIVSNNAASDSEEDASDSDDEWGIVHSPQVHPARPRASRVQLTTKSHGVEVSLALSVAACHRAPPGLRLQRSRATWTFSSVDRYSHSTQSPRYSIRFVQAPTFTVDLLMLSQFDAYVTDRLEFATRCHAEWTKGSTLSWSPRLTTVANVNASEIETNPQPARADESATKTTQKTPSDPRTQPTCSDTRTHQTCGDTRAQQTPRDTCTHQTRGDSRIQQPRGGSRALQIRSDTRTQQTHGDCRAQQIRGDTRAQQTQPRQQPCPISRDRQPSSAISHVEFTKKKQTRRPRMQRFTPEARYMSYEQSASYTRKCQVNIERRRALQSVSSKNPADSRCSWINQAVGSHMFSGTVARFA